MSQGNNSRIGPGRLPAAVAAKRVVLEDPGEWDAAIADTEGPQLILAGPGTGKTEFLARRVAYLISAGHSPASLLALTFSRRAAAELEGRIGSHLKRPVAEASASTFHSLAFRMLELDRHRSGSHVPVLLTGPEQVRLVAGLLDAEDPRRWPANIRPLLGSATFAGEVTDFIMRCQERMIDTDRLAELASERADWRPLPGFIRRYRTELAESRKIDYGTLIGQALELAEAAIPGSRFGHVVVDEYQDTSPAQARLAQLLAGEEVNLTAAADPNQSIYGFRGADPDNVSRLLPALASADHPATIYVLGRSLRVPGEILDSARRLVDANGPSLDAGEVTPADHQGQVEAYTFDQRSAEAEWIAAEIETLRVVEGVPLDHMAVLVRSTRHFLPELSRALDRRRIPHDRPDTRLVDHPAIRLIADVVAAGISPAGSRETELAVRRLLLGPLLSLPLARERELNRLGRIAAAPWHRLIRQELPEAGALADLLADPAWATELPAVEGFWHLWDRLPGLDRLVLDPDRRDYRNAWATFARLLERQAERDPALSLAAYLEAAATGDFEASPQLRHVRHDDERLVVTTLHQAKGLEFDVVFIADAVEGVFPDSRRSRSLLQAHMLEAPTDLTGREVVARRLREERRLAYTASTRARRRVVWTATTAGIDESERRPSRFILAAAGVDSFEDIGPPQATPDDDVFAPLSLLDAEARLRRLLMDPEAAAPRRLGALATLVSAPHWDPTAFAGVAEPGPDSGLVDPGLRLSPSQADSYQKCPRNYALERRLRALDFDSPYATFGSLVHEVLENTEKRAAERGLAHAELATALEELDRVWDRYPPFGPPPLDDAWKRRAVQFLEQMYLEWPGGDDPAIALEIELRTRVGDVEWVGRADRIDRSGDGIKVVDYKSSKNPPPLKEVATSLQLGYYALAAAEHPELSAHGPPVAAELWYPLAKRKDKVFPFDMSHLDHVRSALVEVAAGIRAEDWTPRVGSHCGRCTFRGVCPAWPEGREGFR